MPTRRRDPRDPRETPRHHHPIRTSLPLLTATALAATLAFGASPATAATPILRPAAGTPAAAGPAADGAPGATSHQALSRKDCVGTARTTTSKIWFTVANGVLSDVYAPTVDATNVETMQYLVTDGSTFTDLQTRDMTYTAQGDPTGMVCTVTATAKSGAYRLVTTYFTDPARNSVVARTRYQPLTSKAKSFHLYVRLDANAGGNGGGGSANAGGDTSVVDTSTGQPIPVTFDTVATSQSPRTAYAVPSYLALRADRPFGAVDSGFVGTPSDGLSKLDQAHTLGGAGGTATATGGNTEQTAALSLDREGTTTLSLGFGTSQADAVKTASATSGTSTARMLATYEAQWLGYDAHLRFPNLSRTKLTTAQRLTALGKYYQSANVVKASEDKTYPGAIVAGLDAPWGQDVVANDPADQFHSGYREVFARDLYEAWTALYTDGDIATAQDTVRYLLTKSQQANGSQPRNSLLDGTKAADSFNDQLDESAYPILMAWQSGLASDRTLWPHVKRAADFLVSHGPSFGVERWEEQSGYSPSTIAAEIAGLVSANRIALANGDAASARIYAATADRYQRTIATWGVTTTGSLSAKPYYIRLSKTGDPNAAISYNLGNGGPTLDQRDVVDLGFLEYVRLGILPATDPVVANSLVVADTTLGRTTASGEGWLRYNGDGYGDCLAGSASSCTTTGAPWAATFTGTGHPWPVLGAERAQQSLTTGDAAAAAKQLVTINAENSGPGLVPEQVWDGPDLAASPFGTDPNVASIGFRNGKAAGSASPLTWGSASQVRLTADLAAGRSLETPSIVADRYVRHAQGSTPLTVTSPADQTSVGASVTVTGTAAPGATVDVASVADADSATTTATTTAGADGAFTVAVPTVSGTNTLVITATTSAGTAQATRTVTNDSVSGTLLFAQDDPSGDDSGPGTYAYPTASDFHAGAFDLTRFEVYDTGSTVTLRAQTRDLTPTFGSTNGAQLLDVYVHDPAAASTSTASAYPGMNYRVAAGSAWSRLVEVQGFSAPKVLDAQGASAGTATSTANSVSRYITVVVPKTALGGTPSAGWSFAVALTGQDGTHGADQTRAFTATPGGYTFGVCADGAVPSAACSADPNAVPKVMDTLTPAGVSQQAELSAQPAELQGVPLP
ncbi:Glucoamylase [Frondihabitans sp. 762G35]|uniref:glucodextranase DOMON-like domain-containing protein n=1 Tax=Frondihabitans sp. 762G35 TaxID=1446794 RepID=UPI000D21CF06|nr:glucodextranase DOMON-like domain-containing protein [Frondihabitans sp. 762G35]ARC56676.1 Glucoamylase [Frondihabitans sp. 762G35]